MLLLVATYVLGFAYGMYLIMICSNVINPIFMIKLMLTNQMFRSYVNIALHMLIEIQNMDILYLYIHIMVATQQSNY